VGRVEQLKGAKSFIGSWRYQANVEPSEGELVFLADGDVELRNLTTSRTGDSESDILAVGAVPWKYASASKGTMVTVSFTLDVEGQDDVLILQGNLDYSAAVSKGRFRMEGSIETGRAEIGARGAGPRTRVGSFSATRLL